MKHITNITFFRYQERVRPLSMRHRKISTFDSEDDAIEELGRRHPGLVHQVLSPDANGPSLTAEQYSEIESLLSEVRENN